MRNTFADTFYQLAKNDQRLCVVVADISPAGSIAKFRAEFPDRFINTGVAEQIMIGMAAGMALRGLRPFAYTIATFALYRPFEFIRNDLCYQDLPVTVVGIGGGVTYSVLGSTHHAMEDIAIATALPGLQVFAPSDPAETRLVTEWLARKSQHPAYLRLGKAGEPDLTAMADPFEIGKIRRLRHGQDVLILGYGPLLQLGLQVAQWLADQGQSATVVSVHTLKPLDTGGLAVLMQNHRRIVVIEEMVPRGGLSDAVIRIAHSLGFVGQVRCFTLQDRFIHSYGDHSDVLAAHGLTFDHIVAELATTGGTGDGSAYKVQ
jgi:transketolase